MLQIKKFVFSPFAVNTYVLYDKSKECAVIDPGCYNAEEEEMLKQFIDSQNLKPVRVFNTHGHIDHIFGNAFMQKTYQVGPEIHAADLSLVDKAEKFANAYSLDFVSSPSFSRYIKEGETITFGKISFETILVPGHSPGSIVFINKANKLLISGDVLFSGSIGRTDLPGGDYNQLINQIKEKLMSMPEGYSVLPGHGDSTTIKKEQTSNVFLL